MMMFLNRKQAGQILAEKLKKMKIEKPSIVIALPRGGLVVAHEVALQLKLPLDIIVTRKISAPGNPEFAIGAVTEDGRAILNSEIIQASDIPQSYLKKEIEEGRQEANRRLHLYRGARAPLSMNGKVVILVDDGIATGFTMKAAVKSIQGRGAKRVIIAVPVAAKDSVMSLESMVDEIVLLHVPKHFVAVGQYYEDFLQTSDEEAIEALRGPSA